MHSATTLRTDELAEFLLNVAVVRPVFVWGQPGIGKSALVKAFAESLGLSCVSLLGSQLAPEDLIGVPQIVNGRSRFCPPEMIARDDAYCLFLDELNGASQEVQKAFYSLILERRIGNYELHKESVVIGAGNRAQDSAIVKTMSSALINRMVHVHVVSSPSDWLKWAMRSAIDYRVVEYIRLRPDHLTAAPPKHEEPFSTPRSWHMLSDALSSFGETINESALKALAFGLLSPVHAGQFLAYLKQSERSLSLDALLRGSIRWPTDPSDRDVLLFLAQSLRARLVKELPVDRVRLTGRAMELSLRAKDLLVELADVSLEIAQLVVSPGGLDGDGSDGGELPAWFLAEVVRDLPRLVSRRDGD
jgi:AAA domain (dynein-related subfamily)